MNITVVLGTARSGRNSEPLAQYFVKKLEDKDCSVAYVDVREHVTDAVTVPPWGEGGANEVSTPWKEVVQKTDAFIMVIPEYNHSFPGEWKILMDSLYKEYAGKGCYVAATSDGSFGGTRVMEHIMPILVNFQMRIGNARLHVSKVDTIFGEDGLIADAAVAERVEKFIDGVLNNA